MFNQYLVHLHGDFHRNKESTKNLANSTMKKKKNSVPIVDFVELLLLSVSFAARLTLLCLKSDLCRIGMVLELILFERIHQLFL